ncbi:MAG: PIN domain-containing protein [Terracidiphilus sp.]
MAIVLDSDVIIAGERGDFDLGRWLISQAHNQIEVAAITIAEIWHGVERATGAHRAKRQLYLENILAILPVIPYSKQIALEHARIWAALESSGKMIGDYDLIIAATAMERGCAVATFNVRHFSAVKGLKVIEPK